MVGRPAHHQRTWAGLKYHTIRSQSDFVSIGGPISALKETVTGATTCASEQRRAPVSNGACRSNDTSSSNRNELKSRTNTNSVCLILATLFKPRALARRRVVAQHVTLYIVVMVDFKATAIENVRRKRACSVHRTCGAMFQTGPPGPPHDQRDLH